METEIITLRLMQTRSLHHLWLRQAVMPEMSLDEVLEILRKSPAEVWFYRREDDKTSGKRQQRIVVRINSHLSVEIKSREFVYGEVRLFSIGGIREVVTPVECGVNVISRVCRVELLNWRSVENAVNGAECELIEAIAGMDVSYAIEENADVRFVRNYLERRICDGDLQADEVKKAFNRVVNPEKYCANLSRYSGLDHTM